MNRVLAPIVVFVYNRLEHTKRTLTALKNNLMASQSDLFIYSDAPKNDAAVSDVKKVREFVNKFDGFKSITIVERKVNLGLANSIIKGVSEVVNKWGEVIVLEDDILTSPFFLDYMNNALTIYKNNNDVISIHGYVYPVTGKMPETFFLKGADCWGWGTWKRAWDLFEQDGKKLLGELKKKKKIREFDFDGTIKYSRMLEQQVKGKNDSWAVRWYASAFLNDKYTLYPGKSLVVNIGNDNSGVHCVKNEVYDTDFFTKKITSYETKVTESLMAKHLFKEFFLRAHPPLLKRIINKFKNMFF